MSRRIKLFGLLAYCFLICALGGVLFCNISAGAAFFARLCGHSDYLFLAVTGLVFFACLAGLGKLPARFILKSSKISDEEIASSKFNSSFSVSSEIEFAADSLKQALRSLGFSVIEEQSGKEIYFWAEKHRLQRWGSYIAHLGVALVMAGVFAGKVADSRQFVTLVQGASEPVAGSAAVLRLDKFDVDYYEASNVPRRIQSGVSLFENGKPVKSSDITFNNPLQYGRTRVFQAQYEKVLGDVVAEIELKGSGKVKKSRLVRLEFGKELNLERTDLTAKIEGFVPDYGENAEGVYSRSPEWKNPAALLSIYDKKGNLVERDWLFERWKTKPKNVFKSKIGYSVKLIELKESYASSFLVSVDYGIKFVLVGFGLFLTGVFLRCYLNDRALKVLLRESAGRTVVFVSGHASRDEEAFKRYFKRVVKELKG